MSVVRDEYGAIDLNSVNFELLQVIDKKHFVISYNNNIYYMKYCLQLKKLYNGLLAYELAKDYGINVTETDFFIYNGFYGSMSKDIKSNTNKLTLMNRLIEDKNNNLEDIWYMLQSKYSDDILVARLMDELVNLFLYDVLIGNSDRHTDNYGLVETDNSVTFCDLFDNEEMLSSEAINECYYSIGVNSEDYNTDYNNILYKFLLYSDKMYLEKLKSKLWIIEDDNINEVLKRIENKIGKPIHESIKSDLISKFKTNLDMIKRVIKKVEGGCKVYENTI